MQNPTMPPRPSVAANLAEQLTADVPLPAPAAAPAATININVAAGAVLVIGTYSPEGAS